MKFRIHIGFIVLFIVLFSITASSGKEKITPKTPSSFAPAPVYRFTSYAGNTAITHDFVIQNKGDATLRIKEVKSD